LFKLEESRSIYKGQVQRLGLAIDHEIPKAAAHLDKMLDALEAYTSVSPPSTEPTTPAAAPTPAERTDETPSMARGAPTPIVERSSLQAMRDKAPAPSIRDQLAVGEPGFEWPPGRETDDAHRQTLADLEVGQAPAGPEDKVVLARGVWDEARIWLERSQSVAPGDSGWYIGFAAGAEPEGLIAVRMEDLLHMRPDWEEMLALPAGCLVVIDGSTIEAVVDAEGRNLWSPAGPADEGGPGNAADG
jgi:hypothetical protein